MTAKGTFFCIDAHTCGNPVRVVATGAPALEGSRMIDKRRYFLKHFDWIRKGLMFEPRGHDMMSGSILYPPLDPQNDLAILFIETSGCLPMCGHGTIGTVTVVLSEGLVRPREPGILRLEVPAGLVTARYTMDQAKVRTVQFENVPSYLEAQDLKLSCPDLGELSVDVAYGGNFYAIIDVQPTFLGLEHYAPDQLIAWSRVLRTRINQQFEFIHPEQPEIRGCSHIMWTGAVLNPGSTARNAVFYGDKAIDRSPCGTGTSARMAQWFAQGKLAEQQAFIHESIIGSAFTGRVERQTRVGGKPAIVPSIEGWAKIYGHNTLTIDPEDDPYAYGFQVL
jgi:4-hydroxyproline epimerase